MADPINSTGAISSLLRAQIQAPISNLKANGQDAQQLINQLQKSAAPPKSSNAVTLSGKALGPSGNLPRGSLVDRLV